MAMVVDLEALASEVAGFGCVLTPGELTELAGLCVASYEAGLACLPPPPALAEATAAHIRSGRMQRWSAMRVICDSFHSTGLADRESALEETSHASNEPQHGGSGR